MKLSAKELTHLSTALWPYWLRVVPWSICFLLLHWTCLRTLQASRPLEKTLGRKQKGQVSSPGAELSGAWAAAEISSRSREWLHTKCTWNAWFLSSLTSCFPVLLPFSLPQLRSPLIRAWPLSLPMAATNNSLSSIYPPTPATSFQPSPSDFMAPTAFRPSLGDSEFRFYHLFTILHLPNSA
jgi:hypothetical protein